MDNLKPAIKTLYYQASGGPDLVLLHGFMGNKNEWKEILPFLRERGCGVLLIDLPGHGDNINQDDPSLWSMENTAQAVADQIVSYQLARPVLLGYSMGGRLALYLTVYFGQLFSAAILESASPGLDREEERQERIAQDRRLATRLQQMPIYEFLQWWYSLPLFRSLKDHQNFEALVRDRAQNDPQALAKSLEQMGTGRQPNLWPHLSVIKMPLLLVIGEWDTKFKAIAKQMAEKLTDSRVAVCQDCGHNVHFEQPEAFAKIILDFLNP